jgi:type VI secretion system protein VasI
MEDGVRRLLIPLAILALPSGALSAQRESQPIARCAAITSPATRLDCYDRLAKTLNLDRPAPLPITAPTGSGKWNVSSEISPVDDSKTVVVSIEANELVGRSYRKSSPTLVLRCKERKTVAYIDWEAYLGLDETRVLTRIDDQPASRTSWSISTDRKASFHEQPIAFIKSLLGHQRLVSEVTPYGENPVLVTFSIAGLNQAIGPLRETCGW